VIKSKDVEQAHEVIAKQGSRGHKKPSRLEKKVSDHNLGFDVNSKGQFFWRVLSSCKKPTGTIDQELPGRLARDR
jgi:hypothetical protein